VSGDPLSDAALFEGEVPASFSPLLSDLAALEALLDEPGEADDPGRRARAAALVDRLLGAAAPLAGASPAPLQALSPQHALWFSEAVLLWPDFAQAGGRILVDSHASATLPRFQPDLRGDPSQRAALRAALTACFGQDEATLSRLQAALARRVSNLPLKQAIAARLQREVAAPAGSAELAGQILALFQRVFGPLPLRPGDVQLTLTSTAVIFGIPFADGQLLAPNFAGRPDADRAAIGDFLQRVEKQQGSFDNLRFPGFGLYDRARVDPALLAALAAAAAEAPGLGGVRPEVVAETLATMVTLIPAQKAELFLVHDLWGHGWEESLCDFEWSYARLVELREPVGPDTGRRFVTDAPAVAGADAPAALPVLRDAFLPGPQGVVLDRDVLGQVVRNDLRGRIRLALNVVVAEALADLVEHKYVRRRAPGDPPLPTSSLLPEAPLKTDLSLRDVQSLLKAATRPYRRLLDAPSEARRLIDALAAAGLPRDGLAEATAVALEVIGTEFQPVLAWRMRADDPSAEAIDRAGQPRLRVNLAQRVMLGMLALNQTVGQFLDQADAACAARSPADRWRCPRACIDLIVLLLGWFYEQDRELHFWHLDELMRAELAPTLLRLERALESAVA
jgi:hypothetical protein